MTTMSDVPHLVVVPGLAYFALVAARLGYPELAHARGLPPRGAPVLRLTFWALAAAAVIFSSAWRWDERVAVVLGAFLLSGLCVTLLGPRPKWLLLGGALYLGLATASAVL